jgi:hypothetical protein
LALYLDIIINKNTIMVNGIAVMILVVIGTRVYKIYKNGGVTDVATEVFEAGSHFIMSLIIFGVLNLVL